MRYINLESIRGNGEAQALIEAAEEAQERVVAEPDPAARKKLIKAQRKRWTDFRPLLEGTKAGSKCWYTESRNPGTDIDVDHFRPKGGVDECADHPGYWWEAFKWRNLRLSCHRGNRLRKNPESDDTLGKGEHFPLLDESRRWMEPSATCTEAPALLDPTNPADPPMLTFSSDGRAALAADYEEEPDAAERVEKSRECLHLDWPAFVEDRTSLYGQVALLIETGDSLEGDAADRDPVAIKALNKAARELIQMTESDQPYSSAVIAYIRMYQDRRWVKKAVLPNIPGGGAE